MKTEKKAYNPNIKHFVWALVIVLVLSNIFFISMKGMSLLQRGLDKLPSWGNQPNEKTETQVYNTIEEIKKKGKLVVLTAKVTVNINKKSYKDLFGVDMGTTKVNCKLRGNKVQYIIPTKGLSDSAVQIDEEKKVVTITVPQPVVDKTFVQVQSNPDKIETTTEVGWARLKSRSGVALKKQIMRESRDQVLATAKKTLYLLPDAKQNARRIIAELFESAINRSENYYTCKVEFQ